MPKQVAIVFDVGSTTVTVTAIDPTGKIVASAGRPSSSSPQPDSPEGWIIWDIDLVSGFPEDTYWYLWGVPV